MGESRARWDDVSDPEQLRLIIGDDVVAIVERWSSGPQDDASMWVASAGAAVSRQHLGVFPTVRAAADAAMTSAGGVHADLPSAVLKEWGDQEPAFDAERSTLGATSTDLGPFDRCADDVEALLTAAAGATAAATDMVDAARHARIDGAVTLLDADATLAKLVDATRLLIEAGEDLPQRHGQLLGALVKWIEENGHG